MNQHNIALLFCNYLQTLDIEAQVRHEGDEFVIYCEQANVNLAQHEFEQFIVHPHHEKYQQAAWQSGDVTNVNPHAPALLSSFTKQFFSHAGTVTLTIFTLCWLVFIAANIGWGNELSVLLKFYPQMNISSFFSEPHRLLGPALFHFSWLHIVFNTMWWWQLGGEIENQLSKMHLVNLFLFSAIVSNIGQYLVSGPNFGGLSGVVYGLVGYVWFMGWLAPEKGLDISRPILGFLLFWLLLGYTSLLPVNVANTAHLLGLISGCVLAYITITKDKKRAKNESL